MKRFIFAGLALIIMAGSTDSFLAQTKTRKTNTRPNVSNKEESAEPQTVALPKPTKTPPTKKNERPADGNSSGGNAVGSKSEPNYFYEFSQPAFTVSKILIEHDEAGNGTISFMKNISDETISDPIKVSPATLGKINTALATLNFFDSTENYQYEKDYTHLGNIKIKVKKDGREREAKFNYTNNPKAKELADEFRKIGQQFIWIFDINVARENQPLESPRLLDALDSMIRRSEVSDAAQMIPLLKELSNDERIPLISRNHAVKLIKQIEKAAEKGQ